jgi:hypothetical protein
MNHAHSKASLRRGLAVASHAVVSRGGHALSRSCHPAVPAGIGVVNRPSKRAFIAI